MSKEISREDCSNALVMLVPREMLEKVFPNAKKVSDEEMTQQLTPGVYWSEPYTSKPRTEPSKFVNIGVVGICPNFNGGSCTLPEELRLCKPGTKFDLTKW